MCILDDNVKSKDINQELTYCSSIVLLIDPSGPSAGSVGLCMKMTKVNWIRLYDDKTDTKMFLRIKNPKTHPRSLLRKSDHERTAGSHWTS